MQISTIETLRTVVAKKHDYYLGGTANRFSHALEDLISSYIKENGDISLKLCKSYGKDSWYENTVESLFSFVEKDEADLTFSSIEEYQEFIHFTRVDQELALQEEADKMIEEQEKESCSYHCSASSVAAYAD